MRRCLMFLITFHLLVSAGFSSVLSDAVAALQPGQWTTIQTNNINAALTGTGGASGFIFGYTETIKWDPVTRRLFYVGSDHNSTPSTMYARHVQYDEATNAWTVRSQQGWFAASSGAAMHGYDHLALDPARRFLYHRRFGSLTTYRWNIDTGAWTTMPDNTVTNYNSCCVGIDYSPELGGIVWGGVESGTNGSLFLLRDSTLTWSRLGQAAAYPMGTLHNFAEYNPVHKVVLFGGGDGNNRKMYKVNATGTVTPLQDAPADLGTQRSVVTVDPVSGLYLVFVASNTSGFYTYNVTTDAWTWRSGTPPIFQAPVNNPAVHGLVGGPISTYGVNVFVDCEHDNCVVRLYKHSAGGGGPPPPPDTTAPTISLTAPPISATVSGAAVTVSATASDNVGVVGVQFLLDGNALGAEDTTAPYSIAWDTRGAANGTHTLSARARDSAGNTATAGNVIVAVLNVADLIPPVISGIGSSSGSTSASISWSTDEPSNTQVEYGTTSSYGSQTTLVTAMTTSHSQTVSGLNPSTLYHYRVKSRDAAGNLAVSGDLTVTTSAASGGGTTFAQKCAQPGVLHCMSFDSPSLLYHNWPQGTACDAMYTGQTWYPIGDARDGPGNTFSAAWNGQCVNPFIDTAIKRSGSGSLKFTIPSSTGEQTGWFSDVFKRNADGSFAYISPNSPLGNVAYLQFYQRFDTNMVNLDFQCRDKVDGTSTGCGGWKQIIVYGNPPNGASASGLQTVMNNGWERGVPQMYGQTGTDDYGVQDVRGCTPASSRGLSPTSGYSSRVNYPEPLCVQYDADRWMEFTIRIEVLGPSGSASSRIQMWVDGQLVVDYRNAKVNWGGGDGSGFGQYQLLPFHTNKDPLQVHPTAYTWFDDMIVSTQPIPMINGSADTVPPAPPTGLFAN